MLESTYDLFREHGFIRGEEQVDRRALAAAASEVLQEELVDSTDFDEITAKTLLVPELSTKLLGDIEDEETEAEVYGILRDIVQASGLVQDTLEKSDPDENGNKPVLCSARVTRRYDGGVSVKSVGRFVTRNPDVAELYYEQPAADRFVRAGVTLKSRLDTGERRIPALAQRRQAILAATFQQVQRELPMPAESENGQSQDGQ